MFSVEIKVNKRQVGYLYCHNIGSAWPHDGDACHYYCRYNKDSGEQIEGNIDHNRSDGIEHLVSQIFLKITKESLK
tara:strand:+ start:218 stop:445 length:228 start_codon:yes stop_codon:yes gene_type:complete